MKQFSIISLICIYALSSLGFGIKQFYCCGQLKSTNFTLVQKTEEKCAKDDNNEGCCKTKYQVFKVKDSHFAADELAVAVKCFYDIHEGFSTYEIAWKVVEPAHLANACHAPPFYSNVRLNILHCLYLI